VPFLFIFFSSETVFSFFPSLTSPTKWIFFLAYCHTLHTQKNIYLFFVRFSNEYLPCASSFFFKFPCNRGNRPHGAFKLYV
jgi:hypothetical protein